MFPGKKKSAIATGTAFGSLIGALHQGVIPAKVVPGGSIPGRIDPVQMGAGALVGAGAGYLGSHLGVLAGKKVIENQINKDFKKAIQNIPEEELKRILQLPPEEQKKSLIKYLQATNPKYART